MNQRGFIALPMMAWGAIAAGVVIVGLSAAVKFQSSRLETCKAGFEAFKATTAALGEAAAKEAARVNLSNQNAKEKANADLKRLSEYNIDLNKRLRHARTLSGILPPAPAGTRSPDRASFNRVELERALQFLDAGVSEIVAEGDGYGLRLSTAAEWARSIGKPNP